MSETKETQEPPQAVQETAQTSDEGLVERIRDVVSDVLGSLFDQGKADVTEGVQGTETGESIEEQVAKAVKAAQAKDTQSAKEKAFIKEIQALKDKLASIEKPPKQWRKIELAMGWVHEDD